MKLYIDKTQSIIFALLIIFLCCELLSDSKRHPMDIHKLDGVKAGDVELIMSMSEKQILAAMPEQTPRTHTGCPNCHAYKKDVTWMDKGERGQLRHIWYWDYNPLKPDSIRCKLCKEVYPNNSKFPEDHRETFANPAGEKIEIKSFFEKGDPNSPYSYKKKDKKYYLRGSLDTARWYWMRQQMLNLARLYHITKEEKYAQKALIIFNAYCDRFPHFLMCTSYGRLYKDVSSKKKLDRRVVTRSGRRGGEDGDKHHMWPTYDLLFNSETMKNSAKIFGVDLRQKYKQNVIDWCNSKCRPLTDAEKQARRLEELSKPLKGGQQGAPAPNRWDLLSNDTEKLRRVIKTWEMFPFHTFTVDGGYLEGMGYGSIQLLSTMNFRNMNGYSDPEGFKVPEGEKRYENFQYPKGEYEKFYKRTLQVHKDLRLPNGSKVTFNDSSSNTSASYIIRDPLKRAVSINSPGIEHVILGDGEGKNMVQAHIGFGNGTWHSHRDTLGLQLWAHGHYLLDDINYPKHRLRSRYSSSRYHNTVTVDGKGHTTNMGDGDVTVYEPSLPGFSAVKVDAPRANLGETEIYSRQLMLVTIDPENPYVIDVFRIKGGKTKDFMLMSSSRHRTGAKYSLPLKELPGDAPLQSFHSYYDAFNKVSRGDGSKGFTVDYEILDPKPYPEVDQIEKVGTKHHFLAQSGVTVFKTQIPANKALSKGGVEKYSEYPEQWPFTIVRHEGEDSLFVVVHEPYKDKALIQKVSKVQTEEGLALEIELPDRTDKLLMTLDDNVRQAEISCVNLEGRIGFISLDKEGKRNAYLIGGSLLKDEKSGLELTQAVGEYRGTVVNSKRLWDGDEFNGFELAGDLLPEDGIKLRGSWIRVSNRGKLSVVPNRTHCFRAPYKPGTTREEALSNAKTEEEKARAEFFFDKAGIETTVEIDRVVKVKGKTWIVTKRDHGLRIDGKSLKAEEVFIPARNVSGSKSTFSIICSKSTLGKPAVSPAGGAFLNEVKVTMKSDGNEDEIEYAVLPLDNDEVKTVKWLKYMGPVSVANDCKIKVRSVSGKSIKRSLPDSYIFRFATAPLSAAKSKLEAGLLAEYRVLHVASKISPETTKPDFDLPGKNDYKYFDSMYARFYQPEYYDGEYLADVKVQKKGEILDFISNYYSRYNYFGRKVYSGYLNVPEDGVYKIYFRRNQDGYLKIDNKLYLDYHGHIGEPLAEMVEVPLTKGLHQLEFCVQLKPSVVKKWSREFELSWEGPGFPRRSMNEKDYFYAPAKLKALKGQIQPVQQRTEKPQAAYAGQPLFLDPEEAARLYRERDLGGAWN